MKVLKAFLFVLTIGFGTALSETIFSNATIKNGGPQTINGILAVNPAIIAVVGDYMYFRNCSKYKLYFEKVMEDQEKKKDLYPTCLPVSKMKAC